MTTPLTLRTVLGVPLTNVQVDGNFTALRSTADGVTAAFDAMLTNVPRTGQSFQIVRPFDGGATMQAATYWFAPYLPATVLLNTLTIDATSGQVTVAVRLNGTPISGWTAVSASATTVSNTLSAPFQAASGTALDMQISAVSGVPYGYIAIAGTYL